MDFNILTDEVVVVVDPYSSGKYLVQELMDQHWPMVAIQSILSMFVLCTWKNMGSGGM